MKFTKTLLLASLVFTSCATSYNPRDRIISAGFFAVQPMPTRNVWCVRSVNMTSAMCDQIGKAAEALNRCANHRLFAYRGELDRPLQAISAFHRGDLVVLDDTLDAGVLGVTKTLIEDTYSVRVSITIESRLGRPGAPDLLAVLTHEMTHAAGVAHSALEHGSLMFPSYDPLTKTLTPADCRTLRAVYGD